MFSKRFLNQWSLVVLFFWLWCPFFAIQTLHAEPLKIESIPLSVYEAIGKVEGFVSIPVSKVGEFPSVEEIASFTSGKSITLFQNSGCTSGKPCTAFVAITAQGTSGAIITSSSNLSVYINAIYLGETTANGAATAGSLTLFEVGSGGGNTSSLIQLTGALQSSSSGTSTSIPINMVGGNIMVVPASATVNNNPIQIVAVNSNARLYAGWITYYLSN